MMSPDLMGDMDGGNSSIFCGDQGHAAGLDSMYGERLSPPGALGSGPGGSRGASSLSKAAGVGMDGLMAGFDESGGLGNSMLMPRLHGPAGRDGGSNGLFAREGGDMGMRSQLGLQPPNFSAAETQDEGDSEAWESSQRAEESLRVGPAAGTKKLRARKSKSTEPNTPAAGARKGKELRKRAAKTEAEERTREGIMATDDEEDADEGGGAGGKRKGMSKAAEEAQKRLEVVDPKRAKRILANRQSAARSKERKLRYISELEHRVTALQDEASKLSSQVQSLQEENQGRHQENLQLRHRLSCAEEQAKIRDALHHALKDEVGRLQLHGDINGFSINDKLLASAPASDVNRMSDHAERKGGPHGHPMTSMGMASSGSMGMRMDMGGGHMRGMAHSGGWGAMGSVAMGGQMHPSGMMGMRMGSERSPSDL